MAPIVYAQPVSIENNKATPVFEPLDIRSIEDLNKVSNARETTLIDGRFFGLPSGFVLYSNIAVASSQWFHVVIAYPQRRVLTDEPSEFPVQWGNTRHVEIG